MSWRVPQGSKLDWTTRLLLRRRYLRSAVPLQLNDHLRSWETYLESDDFDPLALQVLII